MAWSVWLNRVAASENGEGLALSREQALGTPTFSFVPCTPVPRQCEAVAQGVDCGARLPQFE